MLSVKFLVVMEGWLQHYHPCVTDGEPETQRWEMTLNQSVPELGLGLTLCSDDWTRPV